MTGTSMEEFRRLTRLPAYVFNITSELKASARPRCEDIIASEEVGKFVRSRIPYSQIIFLKATGHCPNLSAPASVVAAIWTYV